MYLFFFPSTSWDRQSLYKNYHCHLSALVASIFIIIHIVLHLIMMKLLLTEKNKLK